MDTLPYFSNYGYQVIRELGNNRAGGRVTYQATEINTSNTVCIKYFQFARSNASWSEYEAYDREIQVLKQLDNPSIPRYLDSFSTPTGFCMVQEYKDADSLLIPRRWKPQSIKLLALAVLNILKYLQNRIPPVIHRDIKPDNILMDKQMNVYLVDFGFARLGGGLVAASSVVKGTLGFMPPEQLFNRQLTPASDLYSLGATLICLLTGTSSTEIGSLMDDSGRINFQHRVSQLSSGFINWLQKMVDPNVNNRYANAAQAIEALIPLDVVRPSKTAKLVVSSLLGLVGLSVITLAAIRIMEVEPLKIRSQVEPGNESAVGPGNESAVEPGNESAVEPENESIKLAPESKIMFTSELDSSKNINIISLKANRVYFYLNLFPLENREYSSACKIFDGNKRLVYTGEANLRAEEKKLTTWCWYKFNQQVDRPGKWTFEFYLGGQKVVQKHLTVFLH